MEKQVKSFILFLSLLSLGVSGCGLLGDDKEVNPSQVEMIQDPDEKLPPGKD